MSLLCINRQQHKTSAMDNPILVSGPLIEPIQLDLKIETRRTSGLDDIPLDAEYVGPTDDDPTVHVFRKMIGANTGALIPVKCRYGAPGGNLWVRENWFVGRGYDEVKPRDLPHIPFIRRGYMSEWITKPFWAGKGRPSIHMPRWLSRFNLTVNNITVERLHDITEDGAIREGVQSVDGFKRTWIKLNGQDSWDANPWVWVITFTRKTNKDA